MKTLQCIFLYRLLLLVLVLSFQSSSTFAHETENPNEVIVHISQGGYEPNSILIEIGTQVTFENIGDEDRWPASDSHPSHTLYSNTSLEEHCGSDGSPTFDACGPIAAEHSWSFIFNKVGTHEYHDHLWPHLTGEIIVKNSQTKKSNRFFDFLQKVLFRISHFFGSHEKELFLNTGVTATESYGELISKYKSLVIESDPREAIKTLQQDSLEDNTVSALCHDILHEIGHAAFYKYGSFREAVQYQSDFCNSGYIHGLFESYFEEVEDPLEGLSEQCAEYASGKRPFDLWQCHHGIGHGFMYLTGGDLDQSLELCQKGLKQGAVEQCHNGVYMELFNLEILAKEESFINPENPFLTCSTRAEISADCYMYVPTYLSQTREMSFVDILEKCNNVDSAYKKTCIQGVGAEAVKRNMNNTDEVFTLCEQAGTFNNQETCVAAVVSMYMNQEGSYTSGENLCKDSPPHYRSICDKTVKNNKPFFTET